MSTLDSTVVIVSGLPRSGTSLMMQMLEAGGIPVYADFERTADEDNPKGYYELEAVKQLKDKPQVLDEAPGKVVKIIHMLLEHLPAGHHYKIIFMKRSIDEVLASQRKMLDRSGKKGASISPEALKGVFEAQLKKTEAMLQSRADVQILDVEHRAVLTDSATAVEQINAFLGGGLDTEKMLSVIDPSLYRNRQ